MMPPSTAGRRASVIGAEAPSPTQSLNTRQREVLRLVAEGLSNREIATRTHLSEHTVKSYVSSLLKKLELARRSEAAAYVARHEHVPVA